MKENPHSSGFFFEWVRKQDDPTLASKEKSKCAQNYNADALTYEKERSELDLLLKKWSFQRGSGDFIWQEGNELSLLYNYAKLHFPYSMQ